MKRKNSLVRKLLELEEDKELLEVIKHLKKKDDKKEDKKESKLPKWLNFTTVYVGLVIAFPILGPIWLLAMQLSVQAMAKIISNH